MSNWFTNLFKDKSDLIKAWTALSSDMKKDLAYVWMHKKDLKKIRK